ncbi:MAG: formyltetrahydrofolate deformylase [Actinomycetota bacterium]|jgi:formyltetrahydrofolate deformylase|nr:formyltetrahydrofolate deformylase [Actinomycetota bacterium]
MPVHILTMSCPDKKGIVAAMANALLDLDANILQNAQFRDPSTDTFCMRTRFEADIYESDEISIQLQPVVEDLDGHLQVRREDRNRRALLLVSKYDHCLVDLLYRRGTGELPIDVPLVVSNHPDLRDTVLRNGPDFEHVPVTKDTKPEAEGRILGLIDQHRIDFVVLARYMQILSDDFCRQLPGRIINIHHSFLPGFKGAKPYHQAWERGVKLIGATAHYVTADLDEGPIINQDVAAVSHRDTAEQMVTRGRDIERLVLSTAVKAHAEDRIFLLDSARTVVFD